MNCLPSIGLHALKNGCEGDIYIWETIKKPLKLPDWNLSCLRRITSDHLKVFYFLHFSVLKDKITQPFTIQFSGLLVKKQ